MQSESKSGVEVKKKTKHLRGRSWKKWRVGVGIGIEKLKTWCFFLFFSFNYLVAGCRRKFFVRLKTDSNLVISLFQIINECTNNRNESLDYQTVALCCLFSKEDSQITDNILGDTTLFIASYKLFCVSSRNDAINLSLRCHQSYQLKKFVMSPGVLISK